MRFLIECLLLPFRILHVGVGLVLRVAGFFIGFAYRALGFFSGRAVAILIGVFMGLVLGRKHIRAVIFSGKNKPRR